MKTFKEILTENSLDKVQSAEDFKDWFVDNYNSTADLWMDKASWLKLFKAAKDGKTIKNLISKAAVKGLSDIVKQELKLRSTGWKLLAKETNGNNYESIWIK